MILLSGVWVFFGFIIWSKYASYLLSKHGVTGLGIALGVCAVMGPIWFIREVLETDLD